MDIILSEWYGPGQQADGELELRFEDRQKTRQRAVLASGEPVGIKLRRGLVLRGGDIVGSTCGRRVKIKAAQEQVSTVRGGEPSTLARAAYHLGNRHVWVEIGDGYIRYLHDHVLDDMLKQLGITVVFEQAAFEPEAGAYSGQHGQHGHGSTPSPGADHGHRH